MDKRSVIEALELLPEEDKKSLSKKIEDLKLRDSLRHYNTMVDRCFSDCVHSFLRKKLNKEEDACVRRCAAKFWKLTMQAGQPFSELNSEKLVTDKI